MRNTWMICKLQLAGVLRLRLRKTGAVLTLVLYALAGLVMMAYSGGIAWGLNMVGMAPLAVVLMLAAASLVALVTTTMRGGGMLLACRDYDFIAALPVRAAQHVGGRLLALYLGEAAFFLALLLPAGAVYAWGRGASAWAAVLLALPLAPLIPLALGVGLGALVTVVSARARHARLWAILLGLAATLGLMALSMYMPMMGEGQLYQLGAAAQAAITRFYPPAGALMAALNGNFGPFALFALASLLAAALAVAVLARHYGAIQARLSARRGAKGFRLGAMGGKSPLRALWGREMARMFALPTYALNVLMGVILYVLMGVAALAMGVNRLLALLALAGLADYAVLAAIFLGTLLVGMISATTSAESLEGKARWILQAAPVSRGAYRSAKILCGLTVQLAGVLMGGALLIWALRAPGPWAALLILFPAAWAVLGSVCGLAINLKWPRYDWVNVQQVVKQGLPVLLGMLFDLVTLTGAAALVIFHLDQALPILWALTGLAALAGGLWWAWLCRK